MIKTKMDLMKIRYTRLIEDPFPEHTEYQHFQSMVSNLSILDKIMGWSTNSSDYPMKSPEHISIHAAYQMGYDKAYKEIEDALNDVAISGAW